MAETSRPLETNASGPAPRSVAGGLQPRSFVPELTAGVVTGALGVVWSVSYATLIFSGPLASHLGQGLALGLITTVLLSLAAAFGSSFPFVVARPQGQYAVIVAGMVAAVAGFMRTQPSAELMPTVLALVALTTLSTGVLFLTLGAFHLGRLVRYVPFPVIGGFLTGTGWLTASGAVGVLTGSPLTLSNLHALGRGLGPIELLAGVLVAGSLLLTLRRFTHFLVLPAILLASAALFYATLFATGTQISHAENHGWLLGPLPGGTGYRPLVPHDLQRVDWSALTSQLGGIVTVMVVSTVGMLLNVAGLEAATGQDADINRELRIMGLGNVAAGLGSGLGGFHSLSGSLLAHRAARRDRLVGVGAAAVGIVALIGGTGMLVYVPRFVVGGLLLYMGLSLILEWVYRGWFTMPTLDYLTVAAIGAVIVAFGFLQGLIAGIFLGVVLFVITYSRTGVVKYELSRTTYRGSVDRSEYQERVLRREGHDLQILILQGFLFFGTTNTLLERIRGLLGDGPLRQRYMVLDCRLVTGVDASAPLTFTKLQQLAAKNSLSIVLTGMVPDVRKNFERAGLIGTHGQGFVEFSNLDQGVEWCENRILESAHALDADTVSIVDLLSDLLPSRELGIRLVPYLERLELEPGVYVVRQGEPSDSMYMVEAGQMNVVLEQPDGNNLRLRTLAAGSQIGEIGFYLSSPRTASVVTTETSVVHGLTRQALDDIKNQDPGLALAFAELMVRLLADRLTSSTDTIAALMR